MYPLNAEGGKRGGGVRTVCPINQRAPPPTTNCRRHQMKWTAAVLEQSEEKGVLNGPHPAVGREVMKERKQRPQQQQQQQRQPPWQLT
jgi:hypothetical protein